MKCHICSGKTERILKLSGEKAITSLGRLLNADAEVFLCPACTHCQTLPSINLVEYYSNDYKTLSSSEAEDDLYSMNNGIPLYRNEHMANVFISKLKQLNVLSRDTRILDFGCGKSLAMRHVYNAMSQANIFLYDVSRDYLDFWKDFVPNERQSCHTIPKEWYGTFDVVTSFFSLEHMQDPVLELENISSALKPGGILYIVVPNMYSQNMADMLVIDHVQHYSEMSMRHLLTMKDLALLEQDHEVHYQSSIYIAKKGSAESIDKLLSEIEQSGNRAKEIASYWSDFNRELLDFEMDRSNEQSKYYIVGAGIIGTYIYSRLRFPNRLIGFIDSNSFKQSKGWQSKPVFSPNVIKADEHTIIYSGFNLEQEKTLLPDMLPDGIHSSNILMRKNIPA
jgi:SAM-dependent methyltransferase